MSQLFWLDDDSWGAIEPLIPMTRPGVKPGHNRQIISGILHVLKVGCRWCDCPRDYSPSTTVYNRFNRWSKAGIWQRMAEQLVVHDATVFDAVLQGAMLAGLSGVLVWVGYMQLVDAEPYPTWRRRRTAQRASADLRKLRTEPERADTNYRQALQALRLAWFECESRNPRLVAAIEDELAMTPSPEPPHYQSGMDRFLGAARLPLAAAPSDTEGATL